MPVVGATTIQPGAETTVSVTMSMSKGMDGPHLFRVTVPVVSQSGTRGELVLHVRANFQG